MSLRDYQIKGIADIKEEFKGGFRKVLLWLATGSGKTVIFCDMVKESTKRGKYCLIVVRGRKLVDQASQRLFREGVSHGVMMAGHWNFKPSMPVQVCSIDTLISRGLKPRADLIIIDEAHLAQSGGYKEFLAQYHSGTFVVSVTATPYSDKGLAHIAQKIVHPISMQELIDQNYLVPFRYFAPSEPNLDGVKVDYKTKDYANKELETRMVAGQLTGKIIEHWKSIAEDRPTILFAVNVHHSKILVEQFNASGIVSEHCDADVPDKQRNETIKRLENGKTKVVCNVGIFCTGVDIPCLGAIVMARPTQSYNLFIQQAGRGTRICPETGKQNCILLDHAGNIKRHGFPTMEPEVNLDGKITGEKGELESKICKNCFCVYRGKICPECGVAPPAEEPKEIVETEDKLEEISITAKTPIEQWLEYLTIQRRKTNRKQAWIYHKLLEKFSWNESLPYLPKWFIEQGDRGQASPFGWSPYRGVGA